jgi:DNA repair exonuclease SbcCD ATPase subunit
MPQINVELSGRTVEAIVTLNVSQLNDILRIVIDQSNAHDGALTAAHAALVSANGRIATLEAEMEKLRPDGDRLKQLGDSLNQLRETVDANRDAAETRLETFSRKATKRLDAFDTTLKEEMETAARRAAAIDQQVANALTVARDTQQRMAELKIPDVGPIQSALDALRADRDADRVVLHAADLWLQCWDVSGHDMQAAITPYPHADAKAIQASKVAYVRSRPPLVRFADDVRAELRTAAEALEKNVRDVRETMATKVDKNAISDLLHELRGQMQKLTDATEFVDRRMKSVEQLPTRVGGCEQAIDQLRHGKADVTLLELKAEGSALHAVATELAQTREDVDDLFGRVDKAAGKQQGAAANAAAAATAAAAGRRPSNASAQIAGAALEAMKKRLGDLEVDASRLQRDKADKLDLATLNDLIEALDGKLVSVVPNAKPVTVRPSTAGDGAVPMSPSAPGLPPGMERRPPRQSLTSPGASRPGSSRRSPTKNVEQRPPSSGKSDVRPMVTPVPFDTSSVAPGNSWHIGRGASVNVRDSSGACTPALISGGHMVPVVHTTDEAS